jgi:hypothetical protein
MKLSFSVLFAILRLVVLAQTHIEAKQSAYLEFAGNSRALLSINYERILTRPSSCCLLASRIGIGFDRRIADSSEILDIPLELSMLAGKRNSFFETGIGWTASFEKEFVDHSINPPKYYPPFYYAWVFRVGYRYMIYDDIVIRAAPLLLLVNDPDTKLELTFGLSLGYAF